LDIRANEGRLVVLVALLFACIQAGQGIGENAASALFLLRFGVDFLPYMYIAAGGMTLVLTLAYSAGLGRYEKGRFFSYLIAVFAIVLIVERAAIRLSFAFLYPVLWLTVTSVTMILGTLIWNVAGEVCDARQAKRLFPLFTSAGILGSVLGNAITGLLARFLGTENLLLLYAVLLGGGLHLLKKIVESYFRRAKISGNRASLMGDLRSGFDFVRSSALLRLVMYSSILFSVLYFAIAFPFNKVVTAAFSDEAAVAGFFGLFSSLATVTTFFVSLLLASRIYTRLGIISGIFLMPLTYIFCFSVFAGAYTLGGASVARFAQLAILGGIAGTAWNALFNVVPSQKRGQVLAFNNGVPSQIGVVLSGVLLIAADRILTVRQIFFLGMLVALVCLLLVWRMRAAYAQALVEALRAGRLDVFSAGETGFSGFLGDAAALQVALEALQDVKGTTRRLAAQILGKMQAAAAIPSLTTRLFDPEPEVRVAVMAALGNLRALSALPEIIAQLDEPDDQVREQALAVIADFGTRVSPELVEKLVDILNHDDCILVQAQAAATLTVLGAGERVMPSLMLWLYSKDERTRLAALRTIDQAGAYFKIPLESKPLLNALADHSPVIRRSAVLALASFPEFAVSQALVGLLRDTDDSVRAAAAAVLRQRGAGDRQLLLELIESDDPAVDGALDAFGPGQTEILNPLRKYVGREISRTRALRSKFASLPPAGRNVNFLRDRLRVQIANGEGRLIRVVGLLGDQQTMELIRKSLNGVNLENRAAGLEALETIGDRQLSREIVLLLEEEPVKLEPSEVIGSLLASTDLWLRILAVRSAGELGLRVYIPVLHQLKSEPDLFLSEAALESLCEFGEVPRMNTLDTVSILERVLLLREIPIFADLSPEDLKRVAEIAREEWYPAETVIFRQGEEGGMMFVIVDGKMQILRTLNGLDQVLASRGPGDFVGEMAIIESAPRSATLLTKTDARVLAIDGATFKGILHERPDVSFAVLQSVSRRLREMLEKE